MQISNNKEFSEANRTVLETCIYSAEPFLTIVQKRVETLSQIGFTETAELIERLAARLIRQEQIILEERKRSASLELQLASKHAI